MRCELVNESVVAQEICALKAVSRMGLTPRIIPACTYELHDLCSLSNAANWSFGHPRRPPSSWATTTSDNVEPSAANSLAMDEHWSFRSALCKASSEHSSASSHGVSTRYSEVKTAPTTAFSRGETSRGSASSATAAISPL